jgi:hypothetical protein
MKQTDKVLIAILSIWTFIHCYLMLKTVNYPENISAPHLWLGQINSNVLVKTDLFYPFTSKINNTELLSGSFNLAYYDYSEFFVYVVGAWGLFLLYKFLRSKK